MTVEKAENRIKERKYLLCEIKCQSCVAGTQVLDVTHGKNAGRGEDRTWIRYQTPHHTSTRSYNPSGLLGFTLVYFPIF